MRFAAEERFDPRIMAVPSLLRFPGELFEDRFPFAVDSRLVTHHVCHAFGACGERVWLTPRPDGFDGTCACGLRLEVRFGAGAAA